jgi:thioredoxin 1
MNMSETLQSVTDGNFEAEVLAASKTQPVLVDFWAEWCRPCHMLAPTVEQIATEYAGKLKVVKMNVDDNSSSTMRYNIRGIPTLLLFKDGEVADQIVGAVPKEQIQRVLGRVIA